MSGGDVAPLGGDAVKQIHGMFDWARRSNKGMLLFVDEADAFLSHRHGQQGEALRSAINAMLYRTGDQSPDYMVILATNRPGALQPPGSFLPVPGDETQLCLDGYTPCEAPRWRQ